MDQLTSDVSNLGLVPTVAVPTLKKMKVKIDVAKEYAERRALKESLNLVVVGK